MRGYGQNQLKISAPLPNRDLSVDTTFSQIHLAVQTLKIRNNWTQDLSVWLSLSAVVVVRPGAHQMKGRLSRQDSRLSMKSNVTSRWKEDLQNYQASHFINIQTLVTNSQQQKSNLA
jgi:hypothetical protein